MRVATRKRGVMAVAAVVFCATVSGVSLAGPISPPAGPVGPTMKSLGEMDPRIAVGPATTPGADEGPISSLYRITQPGTYYLTGPLAGVAGKITIWISSSDVTLDLNGFTISGGVAGVLTGTLQGSVRGVVVRNGAVEGCEQMGVSLSGSEGGRLEGVTARGCGGTGLRIGVGGVMRDCTSVGNWRGFDVDGGASATNCQARGCTEEGFLVLGGGNGATLSGCTASESGRGGFVGSGMVLSACAATNNGEHGFSILAASIATACRASENGQSGFYVSDGGVLEGCAAVQNGYAGIEANQGCRIERCTARSNAGDGIRVTSGCSVVENTSWGNGTAAGLSGAGVRCMGSGNRVDSNHVVNNDVAIGVAAGQVDNFIVRNVAKGNASGISAPVGNELAPVVTNPGGNGFSTAGVWSNFVY